VNDDGGRDAGARRRVVIVEDDMTDVTAYGDCDGCNDGHDGVW